MHLSGDACLPQATELISDARNKDTERKRGRGKVNKEGKFKVDLHCLLRTFPRTQDCALFSLPLPLSPSLLTLSLFPLFIFFLSLCSFALLVSFFETFLSFFERLSSNDNRR